MAIDKVTREDYLKRQSPYYDGKKFLNTHPSSTFGNYDDPFKDRRIEGPTSPSELIKVDDLNYPTNTLVDKLYMCWLGHSSVLLTMSNRNILIDPIFTKYASPVQIAGPRRFFDSITSEDDLPDIDVLLLTHNHYDHLSYRAIRKLKNRTKKFVVPLGLKRKLVSFGVRKERIVELAWYESTSYEDIKITLTPSRHFSNRIIIDSDESLWGGYLISDKYHTVYDSGDGGYDDHFLDIKKLASKIDLAIMECGQYSTRWHSSHMFPEESVQASKLLEANLVIPVHHSTYNLSDHFYKEPVDRFVRRADELDVNYKIMKHNEVIEL